MDLNKYIRDIENFPKEGITFKDITPLLSSPEAFDYVCEKIATEISWVDKIVALDARWFIFGGAIANMLEVPFIPVRKQWKLPWETIMIKYDLEYGNNIFEIHKDAILPGENIAIIDDLLATGWLAKAACDLVEEPCWVVESLNFVVELWFLWAKEKLNKYLLAMY